MKTVSLKSSLYAVLLLGSISFISVGTGQALAIEGANQVGQDQKSDNRPAFVENELLVQYKAGTSQSEFGRELRGLGANVVDEIPQLRVKLLRLPVGAATQAREALSRNPAVSYVEENFIGRPTAVPNDPNYDQEWQLPRIAAPQAWDVTTGSPGVVIAIIDTGVGPHEDLNDKLLPGYNFVNKTTDAHDWLNHGTSVAALATASSNNGLGVAGVSWGSKIIPLVACDTSNNCSYSNIANAITYAADHGSRVVNISIAGTQKSTTMQNAVNYAWNKGVVIFAAAGNDSTSTPYYPAACTNVVAVSATSSDDVRAPFSNYGTWIDVAAPGFGTHTATADGGYGPFSGTSAASPVAAGVGALIVSANPGLTATQLVDIVEKSADDIGTPGFDADSGYGRVNAYRSVLAAANIPTSPDTESPTVSLSLNSLSPDSLSGTVEAFLFVSDNVGVVKTELFLNSSLYATDTAQPFNYILDTTTIPNDTYDMYAVAYDAAGNKAQSNHIPTSVYNLVDTTAPTGMISSPADGSTVSGSVTIAVNWYDYDGGGLSKSEIYIDGVLKATDKGSISYIWDTRRVKTGAHTITSNAYDPAGNMGTLSITVYK